MVQQSSSTEHSNSDNTDTTDIMRSISSTLQTIAGYMKKHEAHLVSINKKVDQSSSSGSSPDSKSSKKVAKIIHVSLMYSPTSSKLHADMS